MQTLTIKEASSLLEVSEATVRNWINHGYLSPVLNTKNQFEASAVNLLKKKIESGEINRLSMRANKKSTDNSFIPDEYVKDEAFVLELERIRKIFSENSLDLNHALFVLTIKQLVLKKELSLQNSHFFNPQGYTNFLRESVRIEVSSWLSELEGNEKSRRTDYSILFDSLSNVSHDDTIGIIYQSLMLFKDFEKRDGLFLDPCCGTGQFLIRASKSGYENHSSLYGFDIDPIAIKIARINLLLAFPGACFSPQVYQVNTLTEVASGGLFCEANHLKHRVQLIATNPPWGAAFSDPEIADLTALYPKISSAESFSYFLAKSLELVGANGAISFILPESFLNIRVHSDIRDLILTNSSILKIHSVGRKFKGVFTPVVRLDLLKKPPSPDWSVCLLDSEDNENVVPQARFKRNLHYIFDAGLSEEENQIISKLYSLPHLSLKNNAEWALGIVTGDNEKHVSPTFQEGMEPVFKGSDIKPYLLKQPTSFLKFVPENFQQVAPEAKYRAKEKLVYKFISSKLVFAYDDKQSLTLNSANILIPKIENYSLKVILSLLNSSLFQFVFSKKFNTHKVLRGDLENLPFPVFSPELKIALEGLVDRGIMGNDVLSAVDLKIFQAVGLTKDQIELVLNSLCVNNR
ncbi:N-6 DNA methylase [bacterium]|nr:N-6 DNA methylase [bacterium]